VSPSAAGMVQSRSSYPETQNKTVFNNDVDTIQRTLENKIVHEKLLAYGVSADEINAKLQSMTDNQVHLLAQASEKILTGGDDGIGVLIGVLVIILLFIVILKLLNKEIIIR
jgi:hypothetical protein